MYVAGTDTLLGSGIMDTGSALWGVILSSPHCYATVIPAQATIPPRPPTRRGVPVP
jgi:hypothetical protein